MSENQAAPHLQRVIDEKGQLDEKIGKLFAFFDTQIFKDLSEEERELLTAQLLCMIEYSDILKERLALSGISQ